MITPKEAFEKTAAICARQEKSIFDIRKKLYDWEISVSDADVIIQQLIKEKFIDEERFVKVFVNDKFLFNDWGKIKIRYQLKAKNIYGNLVESALNQIDEEQYYECLTNLIQKKSLKIKESDAYKKKASLVRFAASRGFEPQLIYNVLEDLNL